MRWMPPRLRSRRGARWGSRRARAGAAACLAAVAVVVALPSPAVAFPCGEAPRAPVPPRQLTSVHATDDCRSPGDVHRRAHKRAHKKGDIGGLTVFVLAIAGALLIPIGRKGLPRNVDPYED